MYNGAVAIGEFAEATAIGNNNLALSRGQAAEADAEGAGNVAVAIGNRGSNAGFVVPPNVSFPAGSALRTSAIAVGTTNTAVALGDGSFAISNGGPSDGSLATTGNNTAISLGNGANSYAGTYPSAPNANTDVAIALGPGTQSIASGGLNTAISINPNPNTTGLQTAASATGGQRNFAYAFGSAGPNEWTQNNNQPTIAQAGIVNEPSLSPFAPTNGGNANRAFALGNGSIAAAGGLPISSPGATGDKNTAWVIGNGSIVGVFSDVGTADGTKADNALRITVVNH